MRAITIDLDSDMPAYRQIADEIRGLVARGLMEEGEELPSVRRLGGMLGVNLNTVAKAYRLLAEEGLVELRQGSAARVRSVERTRVTARLDAESERRLHELYSRWVLIGAERGDIDRLLTESLDSYFRTAAKPRKRRVK